MADELCWESLSAEENQWEIGCGVRWRIAELDTFYRLMKGEEMAGQWQAAGGAHWGDARSDEERSKPWKCDTGRIVRLWPCFVGPKGGGRGAGRRSTGGECFFKVSTISRRGVVGATLVTGGEGTQ
jgi:hypothetical protein